MSAIRHNKTILQRTVYERPSGLQDDANQHPRQQTTIMIQRCMPPEQRIEYIFTPKTKMSHVELVWLVTLDRALDRICPLDFDAPASKACLYA